MSSEESVSAFGPLPQEALENMAEQRDFVTQLVAAFLPSEKISGQTPDFDLLQKLLDADILSAEHTWELQALGVVFGDALIALIDGLAWCEVTDEYGADPTLRYRDTSLSLHAPTMLSKRIEDGEEIDVWHIANWLKNFVETKSHEYQ